jgi:hypothetical protein
MNLVEERAAGLDDDTGTPGSPTWPHVAAN